MGAIKTFQILIHHYRYVNLITSTRIYAECAKVRQYMYVCFSSFPSELSLDEEHFFYRNSIFNELEG